MDKRNCVHLLHIHTHKKQLFTNCFIFISTCPPCVYTQLGPAAVAVQCCIFFRISPSGINKIYTAYRMYIYTLCSRNYTHQSNCTKTYSSTRPQQRCVGPKSAATWAGVICVMSVCSRSTRSCQTTRNERELCNFQCALCVYVTGKFAGVRYTTHHASCQALTYLHAKCAHAHKLSRCAEWRRMSFKQSLTHIQTRRVHVRRCAHNLCAQFYAPHHTFFHTRCNI